MRWWAWRTRFLICKKKTLGLSLSSPGDDNDGDDDGGGGGDSNADDDGGGGGGGDDGGDGGGGDLQKESSRVHVSMWSWWLKWSWFHEV